MSFFHGYNLQSTNRWHFWKIYLRVTTISIGFCDNSRLLDKNSFRSSQPSWSTSTWFYLMIDNRIIDYSSIKKFDRIFTTRQIIFQMPIKGFIFDKNHVWRFTNWVLLDRTSTEFSFLSLSALDNWFIDQTHFICQNFLSEIECIFENSANWCIRFS